MPRQIENSIHSATITGKNVSLRNKQTGDDVDITFPDQATTEKFIDVIYNRD